MPSFGDLLRDWHRGAQAVARGDWACALRLFASDPEPSARMCFNVGCVHLLAGDPEAALRAFDRAVTKDTCMAVGFFQRGVANFQLERFQEALSDFRLALAQMRDNTAIDYTQLGLRFKLHAWEGVARGGPESLVTLVVQCAFTLALKAPRGADLSSLRTLLSQALPHQAQNGQLSYQDPSSEGRWVPLPREEALQRAWRDTAAASPGVLRLRCRGAGGRPVLYQAVARHGYSARGPEDLDLQPGDTVDVLCEVDQAWLEGHCDGRIGIFPKCFVVPAGQHA